MVDLLTGYIFVAAYRFFTRSCCVAYATLIPGFSKVEISVR